MTVTVRRATRADAATLAELAVALFEMHAGWDAKRFTHIATRDGAARYYGDRAEAENAVVCVAEGEEGLLGFAYMEYEPVLYAELATRVAWLHDIYVVPEARGSGVGKSLLKAIEAEARKLGANKVLLSVALKNVDGQKFFQRAGCRTTMLEMMLEIDE